jgi:Protein of unknown function (DUF2459)
VIARRFGLLTEYDPLRAAVSLGRLAVGFAAAAIGWGSLTGCVLTPAPAPDRAPAEPAATVYVARRHWHIDVGFAAADLGPLTFASAEFPAAKYLFFGFGDLHYLLAKNHRVAVLSGALWPGPGLILLTALQSRPQAAFGDSQVIELQLSASHAQALKSFIRDAIAGQSPLAKGPYEGSVYYAAIPRYSALHTCNTWAAEALRAGDVPVRSRAVILASQLWSQLGTLAQPRRGSAPNIPAAQNP